MHKRRDATNRVAGIGSRQQRLDKAKAGLAVASIWDIQSAAFKRSLTPRAPSTWCLTYCGPATCSPPGIRVPEIFLEEVPSPKPGLIVSPDLITVYTADDSKGGHTTTARSPSMFGFIADILTYAPRIYKPIRETAY